MKNNPQRATTDEIEPPFYTVAEAAHVLDVSPATIWRWIEARKLPAYRVGPRRIRIRKEDLDRVIEPVHGEATTIEKETKRFDIFADYDVSQARKALAESAGALANVDRKGLQADLRVQREQKSTGRSD